MRWDIIVDHVARICVWKTRQHFGVMHEDLDISPELRRRIEDWIDLRIELQKRAGVDFEIQTAWLDYDKEGRQIARLLKPALGQDADVYYFCESTDEYELVV